MVGAAGGGKGKGGNGSNRNRHKNSMERVTTLLELTASRRLSTIPRIDSPSRKTRPNSPRDGTSNAETDRDRGQNGLVKINHTIYQYLLWCTIIGPHWVAKSKS